jgi:hypothetical protein
MTSGVFFGRIRTLPGSTWNASAFGDANTHAAWAFSESDRSASCGDQQDRRDGRGLPGALRRRRAPEMTASGGS